MDTSLVKCCSNVLRRPVREDRLLGRKPVELMTINHLPGGQELTQLAQAGIFTESAYAGWGSA